MIMSQNRTGFVNYAYDDRTRLLLCGYMNTFVRRAIGLSLLELENTCQSEIHHRL